MGLQAGQRGHVRGKGLQGGVALRHGSRRCGGALLQQVERSLQAAQQPPLLDEIDRERLRPADRLPLLPDHVRINLERRFPGGAAADGEGNERGHVGRKRRGDGVGKTGPCEQDIVAAAEHGIRQQSSLDHLRLRNPALRPDRAEIRAVLHREKAHLRQRERLLGRNGRSARPRPIECGDARRKDGPPGQGQRLIAGAPAQGGAKPRAAGKDKCVAERHRQGHSGARQPKSRRHALETC